MRFSRNSTLDSATGASLNLYHEPTPGTALGVIQINHGLAEHAGRYAKFAKRLAAASFHVYAQDHRGHGKTKAPGARLGVFSNEGDGGTKVLDDVASVHAHIADQHAGLPVFIFGHSMGGLITMNYVLRNPSGLAGAAVWNANFSGGIAGRIAQGLLRWERLRLGSDVPSRILPALTFGTWAKSVKDRRTDFDWLSHDEKIVDAYIADPHCGWPASVGMWQDVFALIYGGAEVRDASSAVKALPLHLAGGGEDPATNRAKAVSEQAGRLRAAGFADVTLKIYPDFRHETLNEIGGEKAVDDLIGWIRQKASA
ncbi:alpha/beta hydrolase [Oricola cellulosilytica]|uniref:Alpha/beta hydrolase n=1 Tax=Oricola cellulosilytica TaxID=1429082 RepID=A0A4R0P2E6_9HYPH|nr:alpha/beta hydrolase [Oricola cellulosilytica]TCD10986.1 alpha/beta hydrolase [Oricola cellulosilytica]